jgi:hypothetical protein
MKGKMIIFSILIARGQDRENYRAFPCFLPFLRGLWPTHGL